MMDRKRRLSYLYLLYRRLKKKRTRKCWVHPLNMKRDTLGAFNVLFKDLCEDDVKFYNYFRMSLASFEKLHDYLRATLQKQNTKMRNCIPTKEMLAVTLRYLGSGSTFTDLHYQYKMGISTIRQIVRHVCCSIWNTLLRKYIPDLTTENFESIAEGFERKANFPHCIGAVDGKHIRIIKPAHSGSLYFNYKDYFSLVLLAVADSEYRFIFVDIGAYGKDCDSTILKNSSLWKAIQNNQLQLPPPKSLGAEGTEVVPYVFVGDEAFALNNNLLRPFGGANLTTTKRIFNYRLSRARRYVECAFGILSNKWRIFHRPLNVCPDFAVDIAKACIILHNFVREHDGYNFEDILTIPGLQNVEPGQSVRGGLTSNNIRNRFADYFVSESGSLPWQLSKI